MHIGFWNVTIVTPNARRTPKLHTMPWSHQALRGSMGLRRSRRCTWRSSNVFFKSQRKTIRPDVTNALAAYPCASIINCVTFCLGSHAGVILWNSNEFACISSVLVQSNRATFGRFLEWFSFESLMSLPVLVQCWCSPTVVHLEVFWNRFPLKP